MARLFFKSLLLSLLMATCVPVFSSFGQEVDKNFIVVKNILAQSPNTQVLHLKLDSLYKKGIPSRSKLSLVFTRDIDFNHQHQRVNFGVNFGYFQIDLITHNDSILMSVLSHKDNRKLRSIRIQEEAINTYLATRNSFYKSSKTSKEVAVEISKELVYAFYCGDGSPKTEEGKQIERLVKNSNTQKLGEMLTSLSVETQSFAVTGFEMLSSLEKKITPDQKRMIQHIKNRNSEVVACKGCLSGLIEKVY
ncbi:hypothetical protein TH61_08155 [Rufibacter sp. DG15C]|uniref:hypothetical protein n=1 Tax=Rufibacter sp. DG15C TaxID=1379909 RepID=UPI00078D8F0E|nr:hypothetical protein [Rufibacter sp. DG15C]AMM51156.1 hypothetical protein TH61_08155 [Rufibacter sp. DG15C]